MLSNTAEYAMRAVLVLARAHGSGPVRADEVADATGAPRNYMAKTLHMLARAGVVAGTRGPHGGFTLLVHPAQLTLARVIDLFDEPHVHHRCLLGTGPCDPARPCGAHHRWSGILHARRAPLTDTTFADLLGAAGAGRPATPGEAAA